MRPFSYLDEGSEALYELAQFTFRGFVGEGFVQQEVFVSVDAKLIGVFGKLQLVALEREQLADAKDLACRHWVGRHHLFGEGQLRAVE